MTHDYVDMRPKWVPVVGNTSRHKKWVDNDGVDSAGNLQCLSLTKRSGLRCTRSAEPGEQLCGIHYATGLYTNNENSAMSYYSELVKSKLKDAFKAVQGIRSHDLTAEVELIRVQVVRMVEIWDQARGNDMTALELSVMQQIRDAVGTVADIVHAIRRMELIQAISPAALVIVVEGMTKLIGQYLTDEQMSEFKNRLDEIPWPSKFQLAPSGQEPIDVPAGEIVLPDGLERTGDFVTRSRDEDCACGYGHYEDSPESKKPDAEAVLS